VKSAISAALHDLAGKRLGVPVYKLWGLNPANAPLSSFTIAIAANDDELRRRIEQASSYPVLKIKLGTDHDEHIIRTVREAAPTKVLRVDANAAWTPKRALRMVDVLVECGVEYLEQPLPAHDIDGLRFVRERSVLPVIADESCVVASDIPRLVGAVDGINIKLSKCGGLREALKMIATARSHGMLVMAGCMIETSLGITAAAHFAPLLDYADFDGAALLSDDPYLGATISAGKIEIPSGPGLGVTRR
jgi:L-Ala-D/L-Glu epimerase